MVDEGMWVRVFVLKWFFIPWEDISGITRPTVAYSSIPQLWYFIQVRKLTIFHKLLGITYRTGPEPVLVIYERMEDCQELIEIIEEHIGGKKAET